MQRNVYLIIIQIRDIFYANETLDYIRPSGHGCVTRF